MIVSIKYFCSGGVLGNCSNDVLAPLIARYNGARTSLEPFPRTPLEQKYHYAYDPPPTLGMAANTRVPTNTTSQCIQQHTAPHTAGCRHHAACPNRLNTQQRTQAAKQPNLPSKQYTIQPTTPSTPHDNTAHHSARHVTTTHYPPPQNTAHHSRSHTTIDQSTAQHTTTNHIT